MYPPDPQPTPTHIAQTLWNSGKRGVLVVADRRETVGFVVGKGVLLLPACWGVGVLRAVEDTEPDPVSHIIDASLHVPDEGEQSLGLVIEARALHAESIPPSQAALIDRWQAYHGKPGSHGFAICAVEAVRLADDVVDGDEVELVSTISSESKFLRSLNANRERLARAAIATLSLHVIEPTAVGIDHWGLDLRTPAGLVRVPAPHRLTDATVEPWLQRLMEGADAH